VISAESKAAACAVMSAAHRCAMIMLENAGYIERELPALSFEESLRGPAGQMCSQLVGTKHDIMTEIGELDELLAGEPTQERMATYIERIVRWLGDDMKQMHELVTTLDAAAQRDERNGRAFVLVSESAINILLEFNKARVAAAKWFSTNKLE
jgi:hypothetical protein